MWTNEERERTERAFKKKRITESKKKGREGVGDIHKSKTSIKCWWKGEGEKKKKKKWNLGEKKTEQKKQVREKREVTH